MSQRAALTQRDWDILEEDVDSNIVKAQLLSDDIVVKHKENKLVIELSTKEVMAQPRGSYKPLKGKAKLVNKNFQFQGALEMDCTVACGHWYKLGDLSGETINLFDHLDKDKQSDKDKLLPTRGQGIGVFSFQNGIQNRWCDFEDMGTLITEKLHEKPLCVGFYNKTDGYRYGISSDLDRLRNSWDFNIISVIFFRQWLYTLADRLPSINPNLHVAHIAHSEGGLIANCVHTTTRNCFTASQTNFMQNHLITATYGAVAPVPDKILKALNTYSVEDIAILLVLKYLDKLPNFDKNADLRLRQMAEEIYARMPKKTQTVDALFSQLKSGRDEAYKNIINTSPYTCTKDGHTIKVVSCETPKTDLGLIEGDHAFKNATYQNALLEDIAFMRKPERFGGIYRGH